MRCYFVTSLEQCLVYNKHQATTQEVHDRIGYFFFIILHNQSSLSSIERREFRGQIHILLKLFPYYKARVKLISF